MLVDAHPCVALECLLTVIHCDEFDVQQEGVFCLEQACADDDLLHLLLACPAYRAHLLPLARQMERLLRSPSCDLPMSCMRIISALTAAAKSGTGHNSDGCGNSTGLGELVNLWVEAGITEALDDIQVRTTFIINSQNTLQNLYVISSVMTCGLSDMRTDSIPAGLRAATVARAATG